LSHPVRNFSSMEIDSGLCEHKPTWMGRVAVAACAECGEVSWLSDTGPVDPAEGMAYLFGSYDLVAHLDALAAPAPTVLAYNAPNARKRKNLAALPRRVWLRVAPNLWLSHDGEILLLATDHRLLLENLTRGA
jgi:hypothetical protein